MLEYIQVYVYKDLFSLKICSSLVHPLKFNFRFLYFNKICGFSELISCKYTETTIIYKVSNLSLSFFVVLMLMFIVLNILDTDISY